MRSTNAWQKVNKVLCSPWLALLLSCLRTGPVHQEISMQRPSQALLSYWHGRNRSTMQTKSLPIPSIIWRLKVRPRGRTISICFRFFASRCKDRLRGMKVWMMRNDQNTRISYLTLSCMINFPWWRPSVCCTEQRSRRSQKGNFTEITTGLASPLSAP